MDRRQFIKVSQGIAGMLVLNGCGSIGKSSASSSVGFGLVTDSHFARKKAAGSRKYEQSLEKMRAAMTAFNERKPDFVIELGDFKDMGKDKEETLAFLDEIEAEYKSFNGDVYHVLGNHDEDNISKASFLQHTANAGAANGKNYYSFTVKKVKFIVLDANYNEDGSDYDSGNFDWTKAYIPRQQLDWLVKELDTRLPVVVFLHQLLDLTQRKHGTVVGNAEEVIAALEKHGNVLAVFQGHHHSGSYNYSGGIHYFTMKGMIEGALPDNNSFAVVEITPSRDILIDGFFNCEDRELRCTNSKK